MTRAQTLQVQAETRGAVPEDDGMLCGQARAVLTAAAGLVPGWCLAGMGAGRAAGSGGGAGCLAAPAARSPRPGRALRK